MTGGRVGLGVYTITISGGTFAANKTIKQIESMVGAHASFTLEDATLVELAELADRFHTGVHIHLAEDAWDQHHSMALSGKKRSVM